jgi:hypothetical protein
LFEKINDERGTVRHPFSSARLLQEPTMFAVTLLITTQAQCPPLVDGVDQAKQSEDVADVQIGPNDQYRRPQLLKKRVHFIPPVEG